jgi:hypothetical protein
MRPEIKPIVVDFPHPEGPTMLTSSPWLIEKSSMMEKSSIVLQTS